MASAKTLAPDASMVDTRLMRSTTTRTSATSKSCSRNRCAAAKNNGPSSR